MNFHLALLALLLDGHVLLRHHTLAIEVLPLPPLHIQAADSVSLETFLIDEVKADVSTFPLQQNFRLRLLVVDALFLPRFHEGEEPPFVVLFPLNHIDVHSLGGQSKGLEVLVIPTELIELSVSLVFKRDFSTW